MIENLFFPTQDKYDIFISHSHTDKKIVENFAYYLTKLNYKVFLDSKIWGSTDELLKIIDDRYSRNENRVYNYSYEKRNFSTAHIHSLLYSALLKAIENSTISVFITGENSINNYGNELETKVKSPWIYQELNIYNLIMRQKPIKIQESFLGMEHLEIERSADISNLKECDSLEYLLSKIKEIRSQI